MEQAFEYFTMAWFDPSLLLLIAIGTFAGIYIGAIPGLSVTMAVSILISFTFAWDVNNALCLMVGIFTGGVYGGSRTAIHLNILGAPSAIATALDGYPLAQKGEAGEAIGLSTVMSVIGGFLGILVLAVAAPFVSDFVLTFQPRDYMLLGILGILLVGSLSGESLAKGVVAGAFGLLIGIVGLDPLTAEERFTFGMVELWNGISFVAVMIGLFGVSEALSQLQYIDKTAVKQKVSKIIPSWSAVIKYLPLSLQTSSIGVIIGALYIHGLNPGPMLMIDQPHMFWFLVGALTLANIFLLIFGLTGIKLFTKIVERPRGILIPLILLLSVVGAYAVNNSITDVYWMLAFGVLGYFMKIYGYQVRPVILGVILSRLIDENWRRGIMSEQESLWVFFLNMLSSPLSLILFLGVVLIVLSKTPIWSMLRRAFPRRTPPSGN